MPDKKIKNKKLNIKNLNPSKTAIQKKSPPVKKTVVKVAVKAVEKKEIIKPIKKSGSLTTDVYNTAGKIVSKLDLPKEIFGVKINRVLMAQAVRVYLANQRRGTVSTQSRGEVTGSTKKIWRQKGTGRARHGSRKAPIFVGGGVVFGPRPRDYSLKFPKKMKRVSLFSALSSKQNMGSIKIITGLEKIEPKTKKMNSVLKNLGFEPKKRKILLVAPGSAKNGLENLYRASKNLEGINLINAGYINTYEILRAKSLILMKESIDAIKQNFLKEKN